MRAIRNFFTLFIGDSINYILNFFATIYLARNLEVSNFGKISFAFAFFSFSSFITNLGLISIGTRDIAQRLKTHNTDTESKYISNVINLRQVLAIITFILLLVTSLLIQKPMPVKLLIILYGLSLFPFALLLEWTFFGWEKMGFITIERIVTAASYLILVLFFVKGSNHLLVIPIVFLISNLVGALFLFISYRYNKNLHGANSLYRYKLSFNFSDWLQLIKTALPFGIGAILIQFPNNFNTIFLGMIKPDIQVGLFSAASKLLVFILIFDRVMNNTTFPIISRYYVQGSEKLSVLINRLAKLVLVVSIPICAGGFLLAKSITNLIYGSVYVPSYPIFRILIWFFFITMLNSLYTSSLIAGQKNKEYIKAIGFGVLVNVILNIILVPIISASGTAIALVAGELVTLIFLTQMIKPIAKIKFSPLNIIKPIFATAIMVLCIWLLYAKLSVIPLVIISALVYSIVILLIKGISKNDLVLSKAN
jgi:O-antigen/teichoic acid export membrane protein